MDNLEKAKILHKKAFCDSDDNINLFFSAKYHEKWYFSTMLECNLVSQLFVVPYNYSFFDKNITVPFLAGIATDPNYRHRGLCNELIKRTLKNLYARKYEFCLLSPFNVDFYRKTSFEVVNYYKTTSICPWPGTTSSGYTIKQASTSDVFILKEIYDNNTLSYPICKIRTELEWLYILADNLDEGCCYIIYHQHLAIGYAIISENVIIEYAVPSLTLLSNFHCLEGKEAISLANYGKGYTMMRIIHLENYLKLLPFRTDIEYSLTFRYTDLEIPNNNDIWTVEFRIGYPISIFRDTKQHTFMLNSQKLVSHYWDELAPLNPYFTTPLSNTLVFSYEKY